MMIYKISAFVVLSVLLSACSVLAPAPTATPIPTQTLTSMPVPAATFNPEPTSAPTQTLPATPDSISPALPTGTPVKTWKGIPIMPGALAGDGDNEHYRFTTQATVAEVQEYYIKELSTLGWELMTDGSNSNDEVMLIFNNQKPPLIPITIIRQGDVTFVLIVSSQ